MKIRQKFSFIIVLFSAIGVSALIMIQFFWIKRSIEAQEAIFDRNVYEAISKVIYQTEKMEIANRLKGKLKSVGKGSALFNTVDSINKLIISEFDKKFFDTIVNDSIINITKEKISIEISKNQYGQPVKRIDTSIIYYEKTQNPKIKSRKKQEILSKMLDSTDIEKTKTIEPIVDMNVDSLMQQFNKFLKRTFIVSDIVQDMFNFSHYLPIEERIDTAKLDSLIKIELQKKGINLDYEYGIYNSLKKDFVYQKTGKYTKMLKEKGQHFALFPSDFFSVPNYLTIYFPQRKYYILKNLSYSFAISIFLVMFVIFIFFYVLVNFIRQKKLSEMRNDFINNMTHEFKTPISTISLACEALKDPQFENNNQIKNTYIDIISQENTRLSLMAEKILQTAIIEQGQIRLKLEIVDVEEIINKVIDNIKIHLEQKQGKILTYFNAKEHKIYADKLHFTNVIYNLIDNAIKYTRNNPEIIIKTYNKKDFLFIEVQDNGIGIAKSEQKKIFEKLYRVPQGNVHNVKGFGLGLNYVKSILKLHDAKITLESELNKGSKFVIKIKYINEYVAAK